MNASKLALGIATATLTMAGALVSPQAAADESAQVKTHDNMIFFRGGFAHNNSNRNDVLTGNQVLGGALGGGTTDKNGWYIGAGFDFGLTDDVWGMMNATEVDAELMFEYKNFGAQNFTGGATGKNPLCSTVDLAAGSSAGTGTSSSCTGVAVSQFTLTAAPKIKFMKGSAFRPWIIPLGLGIHVISPPSNGVTVLNPGVMFAAGAEYKLWKDFHVGADLRYHLTGSSVDGVKTDGLTAGGYLGIGF